MKKTILFLLDREVTYLPPLMAILDSLNEDYSLKVISYEKPGGIEHLQKQYDGKDVSFLSTITTPQHTLRERIKRRICNYLNIKNAFYKEAVFLMEKTPYDLLWVIHEETVHEFKDLLLGKKYIVSLYELNDYRRDFLEQIKPALQSAAEVFIPEYNRACILRVWLQLTTTPTVIPNKPSTHPRRRCIDNAYSEQLKEKKIILYQGYIQRSRNLDKICEACSDLADYKVVLLGKGNASYIEELKRNYPKILHIPFVNPPEHLYITSYAHLAVVKYDMLSLNMIFCAPNKTWEYTGFGIPVLGNEIPGLEYTIGQGKAGICTNLDNVDCIKKAINTIDNHYEEYSKNATLYYESYDVEIKLKEIVKRHFNE